VNTTEQRKMARTNNNLHFWLLFAVLLFGGGIINAWERSGEAHVSRQTLKEFPVQVGDWRQTGVDDRFDTETEKILRADDYLLRSFASGDGRSASVYVGYYASQRAGASYHSPLNCLPGSGWTMGEAGRIMVTPANGPPFEVNRYIVQNGKDREVMIYWYQGRGRVQASEYLAKIATVADGIRLRRSDGAMIRIMTPAGSSDATALSAATELAASVASELPAFVPN